MRKSPVVLGLLLWVAASLASETGGEADRILGLWATEPNQHGYAHVRISERDGKYDGEIVWLSRPDFPEDDAQGMGGQPKTDRENPDPALRRRPILGIRLVQGFDYVGDGQWKHGTIYDPETGKTYKCRMRLLDDGALKVRGYVGLSLIGRTTTWTRPTAVGGG